ncbi:Mitochondrial succinate-fumarate transporter [Xylographa trunciseda]|nr:Mitochondrial succinate-fumarate transporter [Xylographa trunciseda]
MSARNVNGSGGKKPASAATNLIAGGTAGMIEALVCHPLDTIKVRMQLSRRARAPGMKRRGFLATGKEIVRKETPLALYKGLGAVMTGIVPKMAIRFTSYEWYKQLLADKETGAVSGRATFLAGLAAGITEAVAVVTPMEVIKIRLQAQYHSMADPLDIPKYRNAAHALYTVLREEGFGAIYRGVGLTALRQGTNQAVNFTAYSEFKSLLQKWQPAYHDKELPSYQTMMIGLVSGAMGPLSNAPIDTIKTRLQRTPAKEGETAVSRVVAIARDMFKQEGFHAFYKGITPRIMRVAPGQAVTFTVYEYIKEKLEHSNMAIVGGSYEE